MVKEVEGNGGEEVAKRQTLVRNLVKAVVKCDLARDPPIQTDHEQSYDVLMSSLCIESDVKSNDEYRHMLAKLVSL